MAGGLRGQNSLHRARISVGERLLGDVHQSLFGRAAEEGGVRRSFGSEGAGGGLPRLLQPPASAQRIGLTDPGRVRDGRWSGQEGGGWREGGGVRIGTHTLIAPGTENGVKSIKDLFDYKAGVRNTYGSKPLRRLMCNELDQQVHQMARRATKRVVYPLGASVGRNLSRHSRQQTSQRLGAVALQAEEVLELVDHPLDDLALARRPAPIHPRPCPVGVVFRGGCDECPVKLHPAPLP